MKNSIYKRFLVLCSVIFLSYFVFKSLIQHSSVFNNENNRHTFIFKDSVLENINRPSYSWVSKQDTLTHFILSENLKDKKIYYELTDTCNNYYIDVWEFNALKNYELDDVFINEHSIIRNSEFTFEYGLDGKSPYPKSIKYFYKIDGMIINLGENSKVIKELRGATYKGFYGTVDKLSICNKKGEPQIYLNYEKPLIPTVLLFYRGHGGLFLIIIHSTRRLNENIIKILNLR